MMGEMMGEGDKEEARANGGRGNHGPMDRFAGPAQGRREKRRDGGREAGGRRA